jgi:hypothetical protein
MRQVVLLRTVGIALVIVLLLGLLAAASAQRRSPFITFPRQSATITLTNSGITISPSQLNPGPTMFTVKNDSDRPRGVYVTGTDRTGNPIMRHSPKIMSGQTTHMGFWMYQGHAYRFHDYTSMQIVRDRSNFVSAYSTEMSVPVLVAEAQWPQYNRQKGQIRITNDGIDVSPRSTVLGPIEFTITNDTNKARGVVITGEDRSGSSLFRYSPMISPGHSTRMSFWLYEGRNYAIMDYSGRHPVAGRSFGSSFRSALSVAPGTPAGYGAGPTKPDTMDE